ncbi:MAG: hypothetical protein MUF31_00010 [Akkermansiaceae bacterium]|jgi:MYXO-CTERM domain-containing protein|nr:hypothetical protein [Akkermansiaceae bacterium]
MKNRIRPLLAGVTSIALLSVSAEATVVFTDTFASGTGSWFSGGSAGTLQNSSGQLDWSTPANNDTGSIGRSFSSQTVGVGQTIRLTMDYTQNAATTGDLIRVGFYDAANSITANEWSTSGSTIAAFSGYYGFIRDAGTTSQLRRESATDSTTATSGPTVQTTVNALSNLTGTAVNFNIVQGTAYKIIFEVTRTSSTLVSVNYRLTSLDGLSTHQNINGDTTALLVDSFDTVVIRANGPILLDNIEVSVVPEPAIALLGGLGLLGLLRRRR